MTQLIALKKNSQGQQVKTPGLPPFAELLTLWGNALVEGGLDPILRSFAAQLQSWDRELPFRCKKPVYGLFLLLFSLFIYLPSWINRSTPLEKSSPGVMVAPLPEMDPLIAADTLLIYLSPKPICDDE